MSEPPTPSDRTPAAPATPPPASAKDPVAAAEAHLAGVDMAKQRAIVKSLTK